MPTTKTLRSFGLLVGAIFVCIGLWPLLWRAQPLRLWALLPGGVLLSLAVVWPSSLALVYHYWMKLGETLGWINSHIILGVVFYLLFTPIGLFMRLRGRDPMRRTLAPEAESYRVVRQPRDAGHMRHQF